jgi:hypothetical protein
MRIFSARKGGRCFMNNLIGMKVVFKKPVKDCRGEIYDHVRKAGEVVDFTDDFLQALVVEESSGELFVVPIEAVRVLKEEI